MAHIPVNHPAQPFYRLLGVLVSLYLVVFGIGGIVKARGLPFFAQTNLPMWVGLHTNMAFAVLSLVVGVFLLAAGLIGRNIDHFVYMWGSIVFFVAGLLMLILLRTDFNFLGFTVTTCVVSFLIGLALLISGLYGKTGTIHDVRGEEDYRHGRGDDPQRHRLSTPSPHHDEESDWHPTRHAA
jgi:hypothetical protein